MYDIVIAGSGFCGSTIAFLAAEKGKKVLLLERRKHLAGNMFDEKDAAGILVHRYGPHILHTNNELVYRFLMRIGKWQRFELKCRAVIDGTSTPTPFNFETVDTFFSKQTAQQIKARLHNQYPGQRTVTVIELLNSSDDVIREYARFLFEKDYRPYTAKQWGIPPEQIDPSVLNRVPVSLNYSDSYFSDKYQMLPVDGYTSFFNKMLGKPNVDVVLNCDVQERVEFDTGGKRIRFGGELMEIPFVYTGAIDELFGYEYGSLPYRSLRFDYRTFNYRSFQDAPVVAYPQIRDYTRITEYSKLPAQDVGEHTSIAIEYPLAAGKRKGAEPFYPVPTQETSDQYERYQKITDEYQHLFLCGRLADYKYYNMDAAIQRAFDVFKQISKRWNN